MRRLQRDPAAPLVPVSGLDRALRRAGRSLARLPADPADVDFLLRRARRDMFSPSRVKALHRWLLGYRDRADGTAAVAADPVHEVLSCLRKADPLGPLGETHPVLRCVVQASLERGTPQSVVRKAADEVVRAVATAGGATSEHFGRVTHWLPVRVAPVDLLPTLHAFAVADEGTAPTVQPRAESTPAAASAPDMNPQLALFATATAPDPQRPSALPLPSRQELAQEVASWLKATRPGAEVAEFAAALAADLVAETPQAPRIEALLLASVADLPRRLSAAELLRVDAVVVAAPNNAAELCDYGDYLLRARRNGEAARAFAAGRPTADPALLARLEERLATALSRRSTPRSRPPRARTDDPQLPLPL